MDMTGALFADIPMGDLASCIASQQGGRLLPDAVGDTFKGILGSILSSSAAPQQTVFTGDPVAADTDGDVQDMSLLSSKVVTENKLSPATERALKYLSGSLLEDVMGKSDGFFTSNLFELFKFKTQLDLNAGTEKADGENTGITDLWTTLLDSLNGNEVSEMSMFSANLGDALFGSKRDYSKSSGSVLSDLFDGLSTRNKTDLLKASGTDLADIAAMALMASGNLADMAGLVNKPETEDSDMPEADRELFALIEAADDEAVEYVSEKLGELVEQAETKLAEDIPEPAENTKETDDAKTAGTAAYAAADMSPVMPAADTVTVEREENVKASAVADTDMPLNVPQTAGNTVNIPMTQADAPRTEIPAPAEIQAETPKFAETAVTAAAHMPAEDTAKKDSLSRIAASFGMRTEALKETAAAGTETQTVIPDTGLKELYLSMRSFKRTSMNDPETPFVFETNTAVPAENASETKETQPLMTSEEVQTEAAPASAETLPEKENAPELAEKSEDNKNIAPELVMPEEKAVPTKETEIPAETEQTVPEDRYGTVEQILARLEETNIREGSTREIVVKLTPETLGEITVRIAKDVTGAVEITLAAQNRDVAELISSRASELAQSLSDKGTAVSSVNVVDPAQSGQNLAFDMSGGQNSFNFRQQDLGYHFDGRRNFSADDDGDGTVEAVSAADSTDNNIFVSKEAKLWQKI